MKILFGPGGTAGLGAVEGLRKIKKLNLDALEVEFTYGVNMNNKTAKDVGELAKKLKIKLSVHAPYYVNLANSDEKKLKRSKQFILQSCERAHYLDADPVVFHAGFYSGKDRNVVFNLIRDAVKDLQKEIRKNKWDVKLAAETTGKINVFGNLNEILKLSKESGCSYCIDFAHLKARNEGKIDYNEVLDKIKEKNIHAHFSGITWTSKGERAHRNTVEGDFIPLFKALKKRKGTMVLINESPTPFNDSVEGKELYSKM